MNTYRHNPRYFGGADRFSVGGACLFGIIVIATVIGLCAAIQHGENISEHPTDPFSQSPRFVSPSNP